MIRYSGVIIREKNKFFGFLRCKAGLDLYVDRSIKLQDEMEGRRAARLLHNTPGVALNLLAGGLRSSAGDYPPPAA